MEQSMEGPPLQTSERWIVLAASNGRLEAAIQSCVQKITAQAPFTCSLAAVHNQVSLQTCGLLILATDSEHGEIAQLVREVSLKKLPTKVLLVQAGAAQTRPELVRLAPYVTRRLRWPEDASDLEGLIVD